MNNQQTLIKQGWLRALIYGLVVLALMMLVPNYFMLVGSILLATLLFRHFIDRKSFVSLGFQFKGYTNEAALGFSSAIAMLGIGTIILFFAGFLSFIGISFPPELLPELGFLVAVAFVEEILFRGYLLNNLLQSVNKWIALAITAILFALAHTRNPDVNILPVANVLIAGIFLGINYIYTKNLWFSIFFHFAWNVFQGPVLGYDVSGIELVSMIEQNVDGPALLTGGAFGFEGSILCLILMIIFTAWFAYSFSTRYRLAS